MNRSCTIPQGSFIQEMQSLQEAQLHLACTVRMAVSHCSFVEISSADNGQLEKARGLTEATATPMAFQRLPVAANTGAATITPCHSQNKA